MQKRKKSALIFFASLLFAGAFLAIVFILTTPLLKGQKLNKQTETSTSAPDLRNYSDKKGGVSFSYPADWDAPQIEQYGKMSLFKFQTGVTVAKIDTSEINKYLSKFVLKGFTAKIAKQGNQAIVVSYPKYNPYLKNSAEIIIDTIEVSPIFSTNNSYTTNPTNVPGESTDLDATPSFPPTTAQFLLTPSPALSVQPTPNPTLFYQQNEKCTYGCVSEQRF